MTIAMPKTSAWDRGAEYSPADYPPVPFVVAATTSSGLDDLFAAHSAWVRLPSPYSDMLRRIGDLTGWSFRDIAEVIGTSHTTVGKLANGTSPTVRSAEAAGRIEPLLGVLERLTGLARSSQQLISALRDEGPDGETAQGLLGEAEWSLALLRAMDALGGPRPSRPELRSNARREPATYELG